MARRQVIHTACDRGQPTRRARRTRVPGKTASGRFFDELTKRWFDPTNTVQEGQCQV
jgi:hypothetical protein